MSTSLCSFVRVASGSCSCNSYEWSVHNETPNDGFHTSITTTFTIICTQNSTL